MSTAQDTKNLTATLNEALTSVNGYFGLLPITKLSLALYNANIDFSAGEFSEKVTGDKGRLTLEVTPDIFVFFGWEMIESIQSSGHGRYEVLCYATSNYDDHREPVPTYDRAEKQRRKSQLTRRLCAVKTYFNGKGEAFGTICDAIQEAGFDHYEFQDRTMSLYGDEGRITVDVTNNVFVTVTWYRMETGRYEIVTYAS